MWYKIWWLSPEKTEREEIARELKKSYRRERTLRELDMRHGVVPLEGVGSRGQPAPIDLVAAAACDVERVLEEQELVLSMKYALLTLTAAERALVYALYWERKSLAKYSEETGTPVRTLSYRRAGVLRKLRAFMGVPEVSKGKKTAEYGYLADSHGAGVCRG
ncbi:MAG: hypothetical protein LBO63_03415 [Oscillospiraceae bacterium]|jgi:DNA-directed RNA polymerase specialized sigma24 family protein|nr:hypothetical protein [Oscillospiraceae bacterium]